MLQYVKIQKMAHASHHVSMRATLCRPQIQLLALEHRILFCHMRLPTERC